MSEAIRRKSRDHSKFDSMSTAELNEYLRRDAERDDSELGKVLYVMEVLAQREKEENNDTLPDVRKAWASFQADYNTADNDGKPLHDFDDEAAADITSINSARKGAARFIRPLISAAAVICIILVGSFTAKAFGYDIWDALAVWTRDTFGFVTTADEPELTSHAKQIPEELAELSRTMTEHGLSEGLIPGYIPEGYIAKDIRSDALAGTVNIFCQLSNGSNDIILTYSMHSGDFTPFQCEKDAPSPEKYESGGTVYYIMTNMDEYFVSWLSGHTECSMFGIPTRDEAIKIINSLN